MHPRDLFIENLGLLERVIRSVCRRNCCVAEDLDDFASWAKLRVIDNDYAIVRKFKGESSLAAYFSVVVHNLFRDFRIRKWGKWRPSAASRRLGPVAVQLETLIARDGFELDEAICMLRENLGVDDSVQQLQRQAAQLPRRVPRRFEDDSVLERMGHLDGVDKIVRNQERSEILSRAKAALSGTMATLTPEERLILKLRFADGVTVVRIAVMLGLEQKPLYRRIERLLRQLRTNLEGAGMSTESVAELYGWDGLEIDITAVFEQDADGIRDERIGDASV